MQKLVLVSLLATVAAVSAQLTNQQFSCIFPQVSASKVAAWVPEINNAASTYSINTYNRMTMFLAQTGAETDHFHTFSEYVNSQGTNAWCGRYDGGCRYRGRGAMQLTHKYNYKRAGDALGVDLVSNPDQVASDPHLAFATAGLFWQWNSLNALADQNDITRVTKKINGGLNGFDTRKAMWTKARSCLPTDWTLGDGGSGSPVGGGDGGDGGNPVGDGGDGNTGSDGASTGGDGNTGSDGASTGGDSGSGCQQTYTVDEGDSLSSIAARYNVDPNTLCQVNNLDDCNTLSIGQTLTIPCASR